MAAATAPTSVGFGDHEAGLAVDDRLGRAAAVTGDRRDARGGRLEEHDPESLLLEAAPAGPAAQGEHVGAGVQAGRSGDGTRPSSRTGAPVLWMSRSRRGRSRPVPAMATVSCGCRPDRARRAAASMSVSMPLRGTSRLTLSTRGPPPGRPRRARVLARSIAGQGTNRVVSTPGGIWAIGGRVACDAGGPPPRGSRRRR